MRCRRLWYWWRSTEDRAIYWRWWRGEANVAIVVLADRSTGKRLYVRKQCSDLRWAPLPPVNINRNHEGDNFRKKLLWFLSHAQEGTFVLLLQHVIKNCTGIPRIVYWRVSIHVPLVFTVTFLNTQIYLWVAKLSYFSSFWFTLGYIGPYWATLRFVWLYFLFFFVFTSDVHLHYHSD